MLCVHRSQWAQGCAQLSWKQHIHLVHTDTHKQHTKAALVCLHTLLIQVMIASSVSYGSSWTCLSPWEGSAVENLLMQDITLSTLTISTVYAIISVSMSARWELCWRRSVFKGLIVADRHERLLSVCCASGLQNCWRISALLNGRGGEQPGQVRRLLDSGFKDFILLYFYTIILF